MLPGQLLWNHQAAHDVGQALLMLLLGLSYAELSVYVYWTLTGMVVRQTSQLLSGALLLLTPLAIDLAIMTIPAKPVIWIISATVMTAVQFVSAFWIARYAWPHIMCTASLKTTKTGPKKRGSSCYPLLRKELYFLTRFQGMFSYLFLCCLAELFTFYVAADRSEVISLAAVVMVWLFSYNWAVIGFANEGKGLPLYTVTRGAWRTMLSVKWLFYWCLGTGIAAVHVIGWQFGLTSTCTGWTVLLLLLQSAVLSSTFVSFSLLAGYCFTADGRISLVGHLSISVLNFLFFYLLYEKYVALFILVSAVIQVGYFRLYRSIPANIEAKF